MAEHSVPYEDFGDEFRAFVESTLKEFNAVGMAVLLLHRDRTWANGFGFSDAYEKTPILPETLFFAASTTKAFTSAMAAHLAESDEHPNIKWETPIVDLIGDDFVLDQTSPEGRWATKHVTLEDALSHRTGMARHDMIWTNGDPSNREIVRALRHVPMRSEIRTKFEYCNNMYTAVAHSVAAVLDAPFELLLKEHIFRPLRMECTTYGLVEAQDLARQNPAIQLARGHLWDTRTKAHTLVPWEDIPSSNGAGGIISNVLDYSLWLRHILRPRNFNAALSERAVKALRTPRTLLDADIMRPYVGPQAYGLGLYSQVYRGREILQHSGAISGYMAHVCVLPTRNDNQSGNADDGWAIVTMQNSYSMAQDIVIWHLLDNILDTPQHERFDMAQVARDGQAKKEGEMLPERIVQRLFSTTDLAVKVQPTLESSAYEGFYGHIAYHELEVSLSPPSLAMGLEVEAARRLYISPSGSQRTSCAFWASLHYVAGDWWYAHCRSGPDSWITDRMAKVQFVVSPGGTITGMNFQVESARDELAFFQRIA